MSKNKKKKRKVKKVPCIILFIVLFIVLSISGYFIVKHILDNIYGNNKYLTIELNGDSEITLKYNSEYNDLGAKASYKDIDLTDKIKVTNDLDLTKVGEYSYTYKVKYKSINKEIKRTIKIVDEDKPELKLNGRDDLSIAVGSNYKEYGAVATDQYDGDLTDKIEIDTSKLDTKTPGIYEVKYTVKDSSNNSSEVIRNVRVSEKSANKIAVLNYHFFYGNKSEKCNEQLCLRIDRFKEQLAYLKNNGFYTLTIQEFVAWMYGEIELPDKSVLLTVDDGGKGTGFENGNYLIPALEEYKLHATIFLITGWWPVGNYRSDYLDVQSHTNELHYEGIKGCSHRSKVNCVSYDELIKDLQASIAAVKDTSSFCFPFYDYTESSIKAVKEVGFKAAFVGGFRKASRSDDKYKIPRYVIYDNTSLSTFKSYVN